MSLNFQDCHAKIRQVDSQSTIEKAVVVQVTNCLIFNLVIRDVQDSQDVSIPQNITFLTISLL